MRSKAMLYRKIRLLLAGAGVLFLAAGCGGSDGGTLTADATGPAPVATVTGTLDAAVSPQAVVPAADSIPAMTLTLDDETAVIPVDGQGRFQVGGIADGDHTLYVHTGPGMTTEVPFRMLDGRGLDLGTVTVGNGRIAEHTGFDGYHFGFVDADGDGVNDNFTDADGDGICDQNRLYAGYPYMMEDGFVDADHDGSNDRFADADGDGVNDLVPAGFGHGFGFVDVDGDGINDNFTDADGDGVNDLTGMPYVAMPGWADLDGDGKNDFFQDADGDGINDLTDRPLSYGHGFGWSDADGDGVNDRFIDADGDGINDYAGMPYRYGFENRHPDADGDGVDDLTGVPFCQGFGWVDADGDGVNDTFVDADGDGINDLTGYRYDMGYRMGPGSGSGHMGGNVDWPMGGGGMM